ncbi:MAG: hypothetical protein U5S82_07390 [Gammaproteobacteria bacterium]|nr:hypothetical protein [Gammaproteobacteria bacterium]
MEGGEMRKWNPITSTLLVIQAAVLSVSFANVEKGMITVSDAVASPYFVIGRRDANITSEAAETEQASRFTQQVLFTAKSSGIPLDEKTEPYARARCVFDRSLPVAHRQHLPWGLHVLYKDTWNAFTVKPLPAVIGPGVHEPFGLRKNMQRLDISFTSSGVGVCIELAERLLKEPSVRG